MKPLPFREVRRKLEAAGLTVVNQSGSHIKFALTTDEGTHTAVVPKHRERLPLARSAAYCVKQG